MFNSIIDKDNKRYIIINNKTKEVLCYIDYITKEEKKKGIKGRCIDDANVISKYLAVCYNRFLGLKWRMKKK